MNYINYIFVWIIFSDLHLFYHIKNFNICSSIRIKSLRNKNSVSLTIIYNFIFFVFFNLLRKLTVIKYSIWSGICPEWPLVDGSESKDIFPARQTAVHHLPIYRRPAQTLEGERHCRLLRNLSKNFLYIIEMVILF